MNGTDSFLDKAKRYTDITELTPELLRLFIEKIVVHEKEVKWSKHAPQTVEIYYNGIGYVGSGQQDVEEALEAPEPQQPGHREAPAGIVNTMTCRGIPGITCYPCEGGTKVSPVLCIPADGSGSFIQLLAIEQAAHQCANWRKTP